MIRRHQGHLVFAQWFTYKRVDRLDIGAQSCFRTLLCHNIGISVHAKIHGINSVPSNIGQE